MELTPKKRKRRRGPPRGPGFADVAERGKQRRRTRKEVALKTEADQAQTARAATEVKLEESAAVSDAEGTSRASQYVDPLMQDLTEAERKLIEVCHRSKGEQKGTKASSVPHEGFLHLTLGPTVI
eukprot:scaffold1187_cov258-Pinguiococcus_pyrenoidosus.AAC.10